ncbi:MAG TPA: hypothetical protein VFB41_01725 [Solirubrobacteraceae bacterium]|nr:hypothetical protein [Solirubrobacteraceae bacterium]
MSRSALVAALAVAALVFAVPAAGAATAPSTNTIGGATAPVPSQTTSPPADPNALVSPPSLDRPPASHRLSGRQAMRIADRLEDVRGTRRNHPGSYREVYEKGPSRWQVSYFAAGKQRKEIAQVLIDDATGGVLEHWTGFQVAWTMARGYPGAFGRKVNEPWIWIPLAVLFVIPFFDWRRPLRWFHLDLLALSAFSVSIAFFNAADIGLSVPLAYPPLAYLFARMLVIAVRRGRAPPPAVSELPRVTVPAVWLAVGVVFLLGFRIGLNVESSNVIDVGYSGVIGADRLLHGKTLYGNFPSGNERGDTYGPVAYEAYVPAVKLFGWSGRWDDLPAAHFAAIVFDLLAVALLFLIGRRARGPDLGIALAYAWAAYPFTIFVSNSNTNDSLVTVCVLLALLAAGRPLRAGAASALAGLTKFAPLALAPVLATHRLRRGGRVRGLGLFALGFAIVAAVVSLPFLGENVHTVYDRTIGFQSSRGSPFSIWGLYDWTAPQHVVQAAGVLVALALALVPGRRDLAGLAAACAAVLIGLQLGVTHWFYLYIAWFFPLVMIAGLCRDVRPDPPSAPAADRSPPPAAPLART